MTNQKSGDDIQFLLGEISPENVASVQADLHHTSLVSTAVWHAYNYASACTDPYKEGFAFILKSQQGRGRLKFLDYTRDRIEAALSQIVSIANGRGANLKRISQASDVVYVDPNAIVDFYHEPEKGGFSHGKFTTVLRDIHEREADNWAGIRFAVNTSAQDRDQALRSLLGDLEKDWLSLRRDSGADDVSVYNSIGGKCDAFFRISCIKDIEFSAHYDEDGEEEPRFGFELVVEDPKSRKQKNCYFGFGNNDVAAKAAWVNLREKVIQRNLELKKTAPEYPFSAVARDIASGAVTSEEASVSVLESKPAPKTRKRPKVVTARPVNKSPILGKT